MSFGVPDKSYVIVRLHNMLIFILRRYYVSSWDIFPEKSPSMGWSLDFLQITLYRIYTSESISEKATQPSVVSASPANDFATSLRAQLVAS